MIRGYLYNIYIRIIYCIEERNTLSMIHTNRHIGYYYCYEVIKFFVTTIVLKMSK